MTPDELHVARSGSPRSGEVIITDAERHHDDSRWQQGREYDEIARRFFAMFLEMKVQLEDGDLHPPEGWEKEQRQYRKIIEKLKEAVRETTTDSARFEESLALAEEANTKLRDRVNELVLENGILLRRLEGFLKKHDEVERVGYSLMELMSPESRREFEKLMKEVPRAKD